MSRPANNVPMLSYRLILPPGWAHLPLRGNTDSAVDTILNGVFAELPADKYGPFRSELRKRIVTQIAIARENQGIDLYLPVAAVRGVAIPASFVVAILPFDSQQEAPPPQELLVAYAAHVKEGTILELDSSPAVRSRRVEPGPPAAKDGMQFPSVRVDYLLSIPEGADNWLTISFSTVGDGNPESDFSTVMVELFDSIISTFRWQRPE